MREHGTHACYVWGPASGAGEGCRCAECAASNSRYERDRSRRVEPPYVSATKAREHVAWLAEQGVGLKQVCKASGVSQGALWKLIYGKRLVDGSQRPSKRIRPATESAILAVTPSQGAAGSRVPAGPVWEHVTILLGRGWTKGAIARAIGQGGPGLQIGRQVVTRRHASTIRGLLDQPVPLDVGKAWSAHHQAAATAEPAKPPVYDDRDKVTLRLVEMLEARIDENAWRRRAACTGRPLWLFFPARGDHQTVAAAKQVCETCPVRTDCLAANLHVRDGVFGGLSAHERRDLRSQEVVAS